MEELYNQTHEIKFHIAIQKCFTEDDTKPFVEIMKTIDEDDTLKNHPHYTYESFILEIAEIHRMWYSNKLISEL